ncbi:MAG: hypothetical protein WA113_06500 [Desulfitobacteriaceae bacterium]
MSLENLFVGAFVFTRSGAVQGYFIDLVPLSDQGGAAVKAENLME